MTRIFSTPDSLPLPPRIARNAVTVEGGFDVPDYVAREMCDSYGFSMDAPVVVVREVPAPRPAPVRPPVPVLDVPPPTEPVLEAREDDDDAPEATEASRGGVMPRIRRGGGR